MPVLRGAHVRLQLFTVPGQVYFGATRKLVLTGADGVVFVADSQPGRQDANQEALEDLVMNLAEHNLALGTLPHTFHWNKRDLPDVVSIPELDRTLNPQGAPSIGTVATEGEGVFAGLERITRMVLQAYEADLPKSDAEAVERPPTAERAASEETTIADALRGLAEAPERARLTPSDGVARPSAPSSQGVALAPPSSLESIPSPIPRRQTGSYEIPPNGAAAPLTQASPGAKGAPSSRRATPPPFAEPERPEARIATPPPSAPPAAPAIEASPPVSAAEPVAPPEERRSRRDLRETAASSPPASRSLPSGPAFSFAALWGESDRDVARQAEAALASADAEAAVLVCDVLVTRLLASAAGLSGNAEAPRDPSLVVLLLGLDGRRYLAFRASVRAARAHEEVTQVDALDAYAFAIEVGRGLAQLPR